MRRIVIKIGSNVITRPDATLDVSRIAMIVDEVAALHRQGAQVILVSSGAVASGRGELRETAPADGLDSVSARQLYSAVGQAKLINRYYDLFREHGIVCGQVLTMKECFATRHLYLNQKNCIEVMLAHGVIPIVNENDTVSVTELMFTDNDELSGLIATMLDAEMLLILSNVDGVYDGDPRQAGSRLLATIEAGRRIDRRAFATAGSSFGRGGMGTKYATARRVAEEGIAVVIANGRRAGIISAVVAGDRAVPFTLFEPAEHRASAVKKWIASSGGFAKGEVRVNAGAAQALTSGKAVSVLLVGVTDIAGDFRKGDIARVLAPDGTVIAVGKVSLSADKARKAIGKRGIAPLIHYDYLSLDV